MENQFIRVRTRPQQYATIGVKSAVFVGYNPLFEVEQYKYRMLTVLKSSMSFTTINDVVVVVVVVVGIIVIHRS
jgi:hypothetical protein